MGNMLWGWGFRSIQIKGKNMENLDKKLLLVNHFTKWDNI